MHRQAPLWLAVLVLGYATLPLAHLLGEFSARPIVVPFYGVSAAFASGAVRLPEAGPTDGHETGTRHTGCPVCAGLVSSRGVLANLPPCSTAPARAVRLGSPEPSDPPCLTPRRGSALPRAPPHPV
jgi:hypothetical protein